MFSSLVRGSGTWDGRLELFEEEFDESSVAVLFPSIPKISKSAVTADNVTCRTAELMLCNQPEEVHLTQLPKTFLTRKGAIVLYTSLNQAKQNCEQNIYNDVGCPEINKKGKQDQHRNYKYISRNQKGKLLNFLDAFTSEQPVDRQITISELDLGNLSYQRSRRSSVGCRHRPKSVPAALPPEPEHPKAHPRITSAKPSPPTRALGKLQFQNARSQFEHEVSTSHLRTGDFVSQPSLSEVAQVIERDQTPNTVTASELVYCHTIIIPRPPSEGQPEHVKGQPEHVKGQPEHVKGQPEHVDGQPEHVKGQPEHVDDQPEHVKGQPEHVDGQPEHMEGISRASSASWYSSWWARDDVSLSFYNDDLKPSTNTKKDHASKEADFNAKFVEGVGRWHGDHRESLSGTGGGYSISRPVSSVWSSVWENSSENGISKIEDDDDDDHNYPGFQDERVSKVSLSSPCASAVQGPGSEKFSGNVSCEGKLGDDDDLCLEEEQMSEVNSRVCFGKQDFEGSERMSSLENGGDCGGNCLTNAPRPASSRSQDCSSEKDFPENEDAFSLGNGGAMAEEIPGNGPRPASSRSQIISSKQHFAENENMNFLGNGGGTAEDRLRESARPMSSKSQVLSRNGSGCAEDVLESTSGQPENSHFCSRKDDSALDNDDVSETDGLSVSECGNSQVAFEELEGFGNTSSLEKDGDCGRDVPCSRSSQVHSVEQDLFMEDTNVFETSEIEPGFMSSQLHSSEQGFDIEKDTCSVSGTNYARTLTDSRNLKLFSSKRDFPGRRNMSSVETIETVASVNRVKSAPCSRENCDRRHSQRLSPRKSFSAGFFRSLPRDTYPGNTTSPTSQQTSVRVPSATSVNETYDEEEVFSSTEDVLEHSDVDEPNMEHLDSAEKNKPSNEQNLVQPLSPASVMVNDNDNGDEILDGLPNKTAERYNESVSSLVTDDAAQHAQVVNVPEETRLLGGLQVEHNDDDDDSLFEAPIDTPYTIVQQKIQPTELELETAAVEKREIVKPSTIGPLRNRNPPPQSEKLLGNLPKDDEKFLANSTKINPKLPVHENAQNMTKPKETKTQKAKVKDEHLDVQGVGKNEVKVLEGKENVGVNVKSKVDLSDLKRLIGKNSTTKPEVTNKRPFSKKSKSPKQTRKKNLAEDTETNLDVIPTIDNDLLKVLENQDGDIELSEEALNQFAPVENFQDSYLAVLPEEKSPKNTGAYSPSKVRKTTKKGRIRKRKDNVAIEKNKEAEERRGKILEEKEKREDELRLLKEREEEQSRLHEVVKEKQRTIEEERDKRLEQEAQARQLEEEAEAELRDTRRKAKEEREKRREEEAERRRTEVQRKREEKRSRELDIQKREQELEKQRVGREQRMAELQAQREREKELEKMAEEQRREEERLRLLELEEERKAEEERIREAEEALQQMVREREYREQMRRIAEVQQAKLEREETERRLREQEERAAIEEERARIEREREERENEERARIRDLRKHEAIARIRAAHEASKRRAWALQRRERNVDRMAHLRSARQSQKLTEAFTFSYHVHVPRKVWELPYNWNSKKKRGFRPPARKKTSSKVGALE